MNVFALVFCPAGTPDAEVIGVYTDPTGPLITSAIAKIHWDGYDENDYIVEEVMLDK